MTASRAIEKIPDYDGPVGASSARDPISDDTRLISPLDHVPHVTAETLDSVQAPLGVRIAGDGTWRDLKVDSCLVA